MSGRRRADSLKGLSLPKYNRPQTEEEMASMHNYRDSKQEVIYQPKLPEYTNPNAIVSLLGKCHITIGPHTFYDTKIYEAVYEKEMPSTDVQAGTFQIQPTQLGSLQSPTQQQTQSNAQSLTQSPQSGIQTPLQQPLPATHTQHSSQAKTSPTSSTQSFPRPIHPAIQPRPPTQPQTLSQTQVPIQPRVTLPRISARPVTNTTVASALPINVPPQATPQLTAFMQTVLQSVNPTQILAIQEHLRHPQVAAHMSIEQKNALISQLTIIHQLLTSTQLAQQKSQQQSVHLRTQSPAMKVRQVVRHEVLLEFKETKNDKWLFPKDAILEALSMSEPYDVLASFYLPQNEETSGSKQQHQPVTMHMTNITQPMLDALKKATNDVTTVFKSMAAKVNKQPNRVYLQYCLPCDYPEDLLEIDIMDYTTNKKQKPRNGEGNKASSRTSTSTPKRAKTVPDVSASVAPVQTTGGNKRCAYCFCKSTPMWRRGPDGAGKILQGTSANRATEANGDSATVSPSPKSRKYSLSAACTSATATTTSKVKKKPGRSLSMSEGALSHTDDDENRDKNLGDTGENLNAESQKSGSGRRASASSKKNSFKGMPTPRASTTAPTSTTNSPTTLGGGGGFPINLKLNSISFGSSENNLIGGNSNNNNQQGGSYYFSQPNCSAQVFEDCLKIRLEKDGYEKTSIDIWKENIDFLNFENERDLATGIPLLSVQAHVNQHLNR
ncbi:12730_t:CDS:2 [Racocetra fulgida]|uniref:12730_t:CDS:1 n=1 Tax=Racocetra fulgida TaxID=60492 RepID=A0A9N8W6W7_9GLOM|nr:12730_t:CDS:2 [Racocetra fulgida]